MVTSKELFENVSFDNTQQIMKKQAKLPGMQTVEFLDSYAGANLYFVVMADHNSDTSGRQTFQSYS